MKKILTVFILIIAATIIIVPKMMGSQYQQQLTGVIKAINANPPYHAKLIKTDNGWFGSTSTVAVSVDLSKVDPSFAKKLGQDSFKSDIVIHAHYGPVILNGGPKLALFSIDGQIQGNDLRKALSWDNNKPFFTIQGSQSLAGKLSFNDSITPFTGTIPSTKSKVTFSGYNGHGSWVNDHLTYESTLHNAAIKGNSSMSVKALTTKLDFEGNLDDLEKGGLTNSTLSINMKALNIEPLLSAQEVLINIHSQLNNASQIGSVGIKADIGKLDGLGETLSDASFDLALNQLNNTFFTDYAAFNQQQANQADPSGMNSARANFLHQHTLQFLKTTPQLVVKDAHGTLSEGKFNVQFDGQLKDTNEKTLLTKLSQPQYWLQHASIDTAINADKPLVEAIAKRAIEQQLSHDPDIQSLTKSQYDQLVKSQSKVLIKQSMDQGAIVLKDDMYRLHLKLNKGKAYLNGTLSPLLN